MRKLVPTKISPKVAENLAKVLDSPTGLNWRKVKFDKNDKLIVAAVYVAGPPAQLADKFRADVASAMHAIAQTAIDRSPPRTRRDKPEDEEEEERASLGVKDVKKAAKDYATALRNVQSAFKPDLLPPELMLNPLTLADLIVAAEKIAYTSSPKRPQRPVEVKRDAAMHAFALLEEYGLEISDEAGSKYCRLAAILTGKRGDDLSRHCQGHMKKKGRSKGPL